MVLGPWSLVLGPWSLVLGPHSDPRLCHCHPFLPFPAEPMHQSTQDGSRNKRLTDEFAQLSKPRPAEAKCPPFRAFGHLERLRRSRLESERLTLGWRYESESRLSRVPALFSMRNGRCRSRLRRALLRRLASAGTHGLQTPTGVIHAIGVRYHECPPDGVRAEPGRSLRNGWCQASTPTT